MYNRVIKINDFFRLYFIDVQYNFSYFTHSSNINRIELLFFLEEEKNPKRGLVIKIDL